MVYLVDQCFYRMTLVCALLYRPAIVCWVQNQFHTFYEFCWCPVYNQLINQTQSKNSIFWPVCNAFT